LALPQLKNSKADVFFRGIGHSCSFPVFRSVDGEVARATNRVTRFGAFFDSVVDRYSDASQFLGLPGLLRPQATVSFMSCSLPSSW